MLERIRQYNKDDCKATLVLKDAGTDDLDAMVSGPRVYSLPNSPTGWREASRGAMNSLGGRENDLGRPTGLLDDAGGLDTEDDQSHLSGKSSPKI